MAEEFFLSGMTHAMQRLSAPITHVGFPVTIYYAFKQSETEIEGTASTGWETFLDALIRAGIRDRPERGRYEPSVRLR